VLTVRVLPVGPFTLVNFFIGAARIRFRDFFLASAIGRIPGIVLLMLAGFQVEMFFRQPDVIGLVVLGLTLVLVPLGFGQLSKRFLPGAPRPAEPVNSSPES
jgi:phospholipase D1/2